MTDQSVGPRCGNNPNFRMSDGDRKAVDDFKARLALQASVKPHLDTAAWVDGDPLMEVIAVTLWERCARDDEDMPQLVRDDPRTIAAFAAAVARAHAASALPAPAGYDDDVDQDDGQDEDDEEEFDEETGDSDGDVLDLISEIAGRLQNATDSGEYQAACLIGDLANSRKTCAEARAELADIEFGHV